MFGNQRDLMGGGFSAGQVQAIKGSSEFGAAAIGTNQSTAYLVKASFTEFTSVPSGTGCQLPGMTSGLAQKGDMFVLANSGANPLLVYPPLNGKISQAGFNVAVAIPSLAAAQFIARGDGTYYALIHNVVPGTPFTPAPPAPSPPPAPTLLARVLGFGDSTMYGIDGNTAAQTAAGNRPLNILATARGLTAYNAAISGTVLQNGADTANSGGAPRTNNGTNRYVADTLGANASAVVVCNYGLNDLRYTAVPANLNITNFLAQYRTIVDAWLAAGCEVILASPCWIPDAGYSTGSAGFTGSTRTLHEQYVAGIWQIAKDKGVKYAASYERMKAIGATAVGSDNIHPTAAVGYADMGQSYIAAEVPVEAIWPGTVVDSTAPTHTGSVIANATPNKIVSTYSEALSATLTGTPTATVNAVARTITGSVVVGSTVEHTLAAPAIVSTDVVALNTPSGYVRDLAASPNLGAALTSQAVTNNVAPVGGADADVTDYLARVATASGTVSGAEEAAIRAFVNSAKTSTNAYWDQLTVFQPMVGDAAASLVKLKGETADTNVGTTYSAATGRTSNGTSQYLNTNHNPTGATGGISCYLRTTIASSTTIRVPIGVRDTANTNAFRLTANSSSAGGGVSGGVASIWGGTAPGPFPSTTGGMVAGFWHNSRTDSTTHKLIFNGAVVGNSATATTPVNPGFPLFVFANNGGGTVGSYVTASTSIGAYGVDTGMTEAQAADYYEHVQTLMTALGRNI